MVKKKERTERLYLSKYNIGIAALIMCLVGIGMLAGSLYESSSDSKILQTMGIVFIAGALLIYKYGSKYPMYEIRR